jgi:hypothetical protein
MRALLMQRPPPDWGPLAPQGRLVLLSGARVDLRAFHPELVLHALHQRTGAVLWVDGAHEANPYDVAEANLARGFEADAEAGRVLVKRCLTPFQWATALTKHLAAQLHQVPTGLALASPFDAPYSTDELEDWEQEDYVAHTVAHLRDLARAHAVPIVLAADMARWWRTHPTLARRTLEGVDDRWTIARPLGRWRALQDGTGLLIEEPRRHVTLDDFEPVPIPVPVRPSPPRRN